MTLSIKDFQSKSGQKLIITLVFLIGLDFFSFDEYKDSSVSLVFYFSYVQFYVYLIFKYYTDRESFHNTKYASKYFILIFAILPMLTIIVAQITVGSSIYESFRAMMMHFIIIIYFYLSHEKISTDFLYKLLVTCMLIKFGLTVVEQFTYPYVPFAMRMDGIDENGVFQEVEVRSGFYRFLIADAYYLYMFVGFKSFVEITKQYSTKTIVLFLICCVGMYMDQTRQVMASFLFSLLFVPLFSKSKNKAKYIIIGISIVVVLYYSYDVLFSDLSESTLNEFNDDNIRYLAYYTFGTDYDSILSLLFGHGVNTSAYDMSKFTDLQLYREDVGIVGACHMLGLVFVFAFLSYYVLVLRKNWKYMGLEYKMMFTSIILNIPLLFPLYNFTNVAIECFMAMLIYMSDHSILVGKRKIAIKAYCKKKLLLEYLMYRNKNQLYNKHFEKDDLRIGI